jgi:fumarylacetoacetase
MWLPIDPQSDFSIHNLPYGIFSIDSGPKRAGVALGDQVIDLYALAEMGTFRDLGIQPSVFQSDFLNDYIALGKKVHAALRQRLQVMLEDESSPFRELSGRFLHPQASVQMHLPVKIGDYTDFYSSEQHAFNVGTMFRDPQNALLPNWKHLPVGYHGRSSSIFVSGTNFKRPLGQTRPKDDEPPVFGPTRSLDFELEVATVIGGNTQNGQRVSVAEAEDYVFGFVLFNDWSARDVQKWEYVPLGPFLAKNFFSAISPWVVTTEALAPFRVPAPEQDPAVLPYLKGGKHQNFDVALEVELETTSGQKAIISQSNFKYLYWTVAQQIAHHTINGCNLNVGDLMASGTISGPEPGSYGSMLELTWGGKNPLTLPDGSQRRFFEDGDRLTIRGFSQKEGLKVGFGSVSSTVLPADPF